MKLSSLLLALLLAYAKELHLAKKYLLGLAGYSPFPYCDGNFLDHLGRPHQKKSDDEAGLTLIYLQSKCGDHPGSNQAQA